MPPASGACSLGDSAATRRRTLLLEILASDPAGGPVPVELTVADSETIRIRRQLELEPGDRFAALIDLGRFAPGAVTAGIRTPGDVFPRDNRSDLIDAGQAETASGLFLRSQGQGGQRAGVPSPPSRSGSEDPCNQSVARLPA